MNLNVENENKQSKFSGFHGNSEYSFTNNVLIILLLPLLLFSSLLSTFSSTVSFSNEVVFLSYDSFAEDISRYLGSQNAVTGFLILCSVYILELAGLLHFLRLSESVRRWVIVVSALLSFSLLIPLHNASHIQVDPLSTISLSPAVGSEYQTIWYWIYNISRYFGFFFLLFSFFALLFFWWLYFQFEDNRIAFDHLCIIKYVKISLCHIFRIRPLFLVFRAKNIFIIFLTIFICWLPWTYFLWPANIAADTVAQLMWSKTGKVWDPSSGDSLSGFSLSDHHPWVDTLIYGFFDKVGVHFGSEAWGLWSLAFLQLVLTALIFSVIICYLGSVLLVPWQYCFISLVFVSLNPIFPRLEMSIVKDSTAMPFFLAFMLLLIEYIRRVKKKLTVSPMLIVGILLLSFLCAEMRKIALEIIAGTFILLAFFMNKRLISLGSAIFVPVCVFIVSSLVSPVLHIAPGGKQEMLAIPLQQVAYTSLVHSDDLSKSDQDVVDSIVTCNAIRLNDIFTIDTNDGREINSADAIKDQCFNRSATSSDIGRFLVVWGKLGLKHPGSYLHAVPWLRDPFVLGSYYDEGWYVRWGWEQMGSNQILPEYKSTFEWAERSQPQKYGSAIYTLLTHMPGVSIFMTEAIYVSWIPLIAFSLCCIRRYYDRLVLFIPWALTIGTLMLLPAHQTRYTWTLAFGAILIMAIPFMPEWDKSESSKQIEAE